MRTKAARGRRGFTLIEMVIVIAMILVLLSIALPMYQRSIIRTKETKLRHDLVTLNKAIVEYSLDKKKAPQAPEDLVPGYVKFIPDDITGRTDTWVWEQEDPQDAMDPNQTGIGSVHSGSKEMSTEGTEYSSWTH